MLKSSAPSFPMRFALRSCKRRLVCGAPVPVRSPSNQCRTRNLQKQWLSKKMATSHPFSGWPRQGAASHEPRGAQARSAETGRSGATDAGGCGRIFRAWKNPWFLDHFPMKPPIYDGKFHCYTVSPPSYGSLMIMNTMALWLCRPWPPELAST